MSIKYFILSMLLSFGVLTNAQEIKNKKINESELDSRKILVDDTISAEELKKAVEQAKKESSGLILQETEKLRNEIDKIEKQEASGELSKIEADEAKQKAAEKTSERINQASNEIEKQVNALLIIREKELENLEKLLEENNNIKSENYTELESQAIILEIKAQNLHNLAEEIEEGKYDDDNDFYGIHISDKGDNIVISFKDKSKHGEDYKHHKRRTKFKFDLDFGWDGLEMTKENKVDGVEYPELDMWPSMYYGFSFNSKTRLFKENSPLHIKYGLGLQWSNYRIKGDYLLQKQDGQPVYVEDPIERNFEKSRVRNLYMTLPVMLQFDFSKHRMDTGFKFGVGAYGGVRWYTWQRVKFKDEYGDKTNNITRNNYFMNPFSYGLQAEIGYGTFSIIAKYELSDLFDVNNPYDYHAWNIGAKFSF